MGCERKAVFPTEDWSQNIKLDRLPSQNIHIIFESLHSFFAVVCLPFSFMVDCWREVKLICCRSMLSESQLCCFLREKIQNGCFTCEFLSDLLSIDGKTFHSTLFSFSHMWRFSTPIEKNQQNELTKRASIFATENLLALCKINWSFCQKAQTITFFGFQRKHLKMSDLFAM